MAFLKFVIIVLLILFVVSALFGLVGFLIDIVRFPQEHEKVKIIPSAELAGREEVSEIEDGLILDENVSIFGGEKYESGN